MGEYTIIRKNESTDSRQFLGIQANGLRSSVYTHFEFAYYLWLY